MQQKEPPGLMEDMKQTLRFGNGLVFSAQTIVEPLVRKNVGSRRYTGMQMLVGFFMIPVVCSLFQPSPREFPLAASIWVAYWLVVLPVALLHHKGMAAKRRKEGKEPHSLYVGDRIFGKLEPVVVFCGGVLLTIVSPPLGILIILAGLSSVCGDMHIRAEYEARRRAMRDAMWEQEQIMRGM